METAPTTAIVEYSPIEAALAGIEKFRGLVVDVKTEQGMKEAKAAHREVAAVRIALEKTRVKVKEDVLARSKLIDGEARRIGALIAAIEDPIKSQMEAENRRIEAARQAAILAEQERLAAEERAKKEAEERRLAQERAKLEAERAKFEEEQRAARAKAEAEERARREVEEKARRERQAEEDQLAAERKRLEDERAAIEREKLEKELAEKRAVEEAAAKERAKQEAIERERKRAEAERADSRRMLMLFCERFEHLHPQLVAHIREYLKQADQLKAAA